MTTVCATCGAAIDAASEDWRLLPAPAGDTLIDGTFCEACWVPALEVVRSAVANADPAEFEDLVQGELVRSYFQGHGVRAGSADRLDRQAVVANALWLLDQVGARGGFWWRKVMCSSCFQAPLELDVTTIPWWNEGLGDYVTTYRCKACLAPGIAETRTRLASGEGELTRICAMLERHGVIIHEHRRGNPPALVRPLVERLLAMLADGSLVLRIGKTQRVNASPA